MSDQPQVPLRILVVDDSPDDEELLLRTVRKGGYSVTARRVDTPETLQSALQNEPWDLVVCDYVMPRLTAPQALSIFQQFGHDIPFIVVSGAVGEETAVELMKAGAHDCVLKQNLARLLPAIQRELKEAAERAARRRAEQQLMHQAYFDKLTGLPNNTLLRDRLGQSIGVARRDQYRLGVLFIDIDRFHDIDSNYGREVSDQLIYEIGLRLGKVVAEENTLAHLGGDKFVIVLSRTHDAFDALEYAATIRRHLAQPFQVAGKEMHLATSIGIALYPDNGAEPAALLNHAEAAMYDIKTRGGNEIGVFNSDMDLLNHRRFLVENALRRGLSEGSFTMVYQPQIDLASGRTLGVEALIRWHDQELGDVAPDRFIPVAEETGIILQLGEWTLAQACRDFAYWQAQNCAPTTVAVNLSVRQLQDPKLLDYVEAAQNFCCQHNGSILELEVTESGLMHDPSRAAALLGELRKRGIRIALDDFGTGYSSLAYLKHLPIDVLKIDKSFVADIERGDNDKAIVAGIIALAKNLRLQVVAEGVENEPQKNFLRDCGCDIAQGFLMSRPLGREQLGQFVAAQVH